MKYVLSLVIVLIPIISYFQPLSTKLGTQYDVFFFWKDKVLWILSFIALFFVRRNSKWISFYLGCLFISTLFSIDLAVSIWGWPNYSEGSVTLLCYSILFLCAGEFVINDFYKAAKISVYTLTFLAVLQLIYGSYLLFTPLAYISGLSDGVSTSAPKLPLYMSLANPNHLGLYCALLFPIFIRKPDYHTSILIGLLAVGSCSRAAVLAIVLTTPLKFWKYLLGFSAVFSAIFYNSILNRVHKLFVVSDRIFMWKHGVKLLKLSGNGPATFALNFPQDLVTEKETGWAQKILVDRPHNMLMQVSHATGILSLIPLIAIVYAISKKDLPAKYGVIAFVICGLFTDSMVGVTPLFAILAGVIYFHDAKYSSLA